MLAVIRANWCTINNIPLFTFGILIGGFCVIRPTRIQSYFWFLPTLDADDTAYLQMSIRIVGQFVLGWVLAPILFHLWQFLLFS